MNEEKVLKVNCVKRAATNKLNQIRKILHDKQGSGIVEYVGIAAAALIIIVVVILPGINSLFGTDVFPGLSTAVKNIFNYK
ncbi:hypothetical protein CAFE_11370 [Caprobacter fermentans]|uniref:Uncharacterized protein n=1 Tax=Caproicibacter fermentans TaxID=2576756 RepID=A0A6N8HXQ3_9FIRM|nr:DUF6133 family protein [Caproicibacter fermentans]MVB10448.1 hypothetical protein [Caproicibacter fermentans]